MDGVSADAAQDASAGLGDTAVLEPARRIEWHIDPLERFWNQIQSLQTSSAREFSESIASLMD